MPRPFHEQSVLLEQLSLRREGLKQVRPFHSFRGGPEGAKLFPHVVVLPRHMFNTNRGDTCDGGGGGGRKNEWRSAPIATRTRP